MKKQLTHLEVLFEQGLTPTNDVDRQAIESALDNELEVYYDSETLKVYDEIDTYIADLKKQERFEEVLTMNQADLDKIKKLLDSDITDYAISKATGVSATMIGRYKNNEANIENISLKNAIALTNYYNAISE